MLKSHLFKMPGDPQTKVKKRVLFRLLAVSRVEVKDALRKHFVNVLNAPVKTPYYPVES